MNTNEAKALALVAVSKIEAASAGDQQKRDEIRQSMLTDREAENIVDAVLRARGQGGTATEREVTEVLNEAIHIRFQGTCMDLVIKGLADVDVDMTQPVGERLVFKTRKDLDPQLKEALLRRKTGGQ